jgi:hypothetical protein
MAGTEGGVSLDVTPNARDFWRLLDAQLKPGAKQAGDSVGNVLTKAIADAAAPAAKRFAAAFKAKLDAELKRYKPTVKVDIDTRAAIDRIAEIEDRLKGLEEIHINVDVDAGSSMAKLAVLEAELDRLREKTDKPAGGSKSGAGFLGGIAKDASLARIAIVGLGPAVVPVLASVAAAAAPIAVALGAAGIAAAGFGFVAKAVMGDVLTAQKKLKTAQDAYSKATTKAGRETALKAEKAAVESLTGSQRKLLTSTIATQSAWGKTKKSLSAPVANSLLPWMSATRRAMSVLKPLITPVSKAFHDLGVSVDRYLANKKNLTGVKDFAASVGRLGASTIRHGVAITKDVLQGVFKLAKDFTPAGRGLGDTTENLARRFNQWAGSMSTRSGIQRFLAGAKKDMPTIATAAKNLGEAAASVTKALASLGPGSLKGVSILAGLVAKMPPDVLKGIALGWVGIALAQKGIATAEKIRDIGSALKLASAGTKLWAAAQWLLNAAMDANPIGIAIVVIGLLVAAFILAWKHSKTFRDIVTSTFNGIKKVILAVVNWIVDFVRKHWKLLIAIIGGPIGVALYLINKYWSQIKGAFRAGTNWVTDKWRSFWNGTLSLAKRVGDSIVHAVSSFLDKVKGAFRTGVRDVAAIWGGMKKAAEAPIRFVIDKVINHGILWAWDTVAKLLHLPGSLQIPFLKLPFADGGIVKAYADGGFEKHQAQIAPAGAMRVWAEPETGGEAYIPLSENKRGRSTQILNAVADSFGYKLMPMADGGILGWVKKAAGKSLGVVENLGKAALSAVTDPAKWVLDKLTKPVKALLGKVGDSHFAKAGVAVGEKALSSMAGALKSLLGQFAGGGGSSAMVSLARTQVGYHEGAGNSQKYSRALGRPAEEWCADFIDWLADKTGNRSAVPWTASAPGMARAFGSKYHSGTSGAMPGDVVFFGPSKAGIYHVGLASGAGGGGSIPTIAGNHGNAVRAYTGTGVAGYAHPNYPNPGTLGSAPGSLIHASPIAAKEWARQNLNTYGWQSQYNALNRLWTRESGWRWNARNPGSGAYGIPQSLPASKMRSAGADYHDNAGTQIKWGLGYIRGRYGSPNRAWAHSQSTGWYDSGGYMPPGYSVSYNGTGRPERLYTGHQVQQLGHDGEGGGVHYHAHLDGWTRESVQAEMRTGFHALEVQAATRQRVGRRR